MLETIAAGGGWHFTEDSRYVLRGELHLGLAARVRALLGDQPISLIVYPESMKPKRAEIHRLLPEAILIGEANGRFCVPPPGG